MDNLQQFKAKLKHDREAALVNNPHKKQAEKAKKIETKKNKKLETKKCNTETNKNKNLETKKYKTVKTSFKTSTIKSTTQLKSTVALSEKKNAKKESTSGVGQSYKNLTVGIEFFTADNIEREVKKSKIVETTVQSTNKSIAQPNNIATRSKNRNTKNSTLENEVSSQSLDDTHENHQTLKVNTPESRRKPKKRKLSNKQKELAYLRVQKYRDNMSEKKKEIRRLKDRERYHRKKAMSNIKPISELTVREQRAKRKEWRINSKKYYQNKKLKLQHEKLPKSETIVSPKMKRGKKNRKRKEAHVYRQNAALKLENEKLKRKLKMFQRREQREKQNKLANSFSPNSKVNRLVAKQNVSPQVRRTLLFGEVMKQQLEKKKSEMKGNRRPVQILYRILAGKVLKKYKIQHMASSFLSHKMNRKYKHTKVFQYSRNKRQDSIGVREQNKIRKFIERDDNSRMYPGKQDFITVNKIKKQKRLLLDTISNLYKKYVAETRSKISFISFWRYKPFWVVAPKLRDRETCMCSKHSNTEFMFSKLKSLEVFAYSSLSELMEDMVCSVDSKLCMYSKCPKCKDQTPAAKTISDKTVEYFQFKQVQEERTIRGVNKNILLMKKVTLTCTTEDLVKKFNDTIVTYKKHVFNMKHQHSTLNEKKGNLKNNEVLLQIDFSMNYVCKLESEVQSMHFGASKKQLSLHTGVVHAQTETGPIVKSYCTVSEILDHQAHGVWAHLSALLQDLKKDENFPAIETLHIFSDGPSAQYRNKSNIYLLLNLLQDLVPEIKIVSWNFTEAGHGKGPMDGVGGYVKRTADISVLHGNDICSAADFVKIFQHKKTAVKVMEIAPDSFTNVKNKLEALHTRSIPNIMSLHQILWVKSELKVIYLRHLSCFLCCKLCEHHPHKTGVFSVDETVAAKKSSQPQVSTSQQETSASTLSEDLVLTGIHVKRKESTMGGKKDVGKTCTVEIKGNSWVAVIFDESWFPGLIQEVMKNGEIKVIFMERNGAFFYWPDKPHTYTLNRHDILCVINKPPVPKAQCSRAVLYAVEEAEYITEIMQSSF